MGRKLQRRARSTGEGAQPTDLARTAAPMADAPGGAAGREEPSCAGRRPAALVLPTSGPPRWPSSRAIPLLGGRAWSYKLGGGGGSELGGGPPSPATASANSLRGHGGSTQAPPSLLSLADMASRRIRPGPCWWRSRARSSAAAEAPSSKAGLPPRPWRRRVPSTAMAGPRQRPLPPLLRGYGGPPDLPGAMLAVVEARAGPAVAAAAAVEVRAGHGVLLAALPCRPSSSLAAREGGLPPPRRRRAPPDGEGRRCGKTTGGVARLSRGGVDPAGPRRSRGGADPARVRDDSTARIDACGSVDSRALPGFAPHGVYDIEYEVKQEIRVTGGQPERRSSGGECLVPF
ncbi:myosin IC heavy chain-like [Panicum virgatum]|uniref:myosin IC heavy chain-like n=1 Tax=Panicum virgatum TaxID=38727 RepID=UPI0019D594B8|nr:myosin IC heavy chain-like [Panicum virgatum]